MAQVENLITDIYDIDTTEIQIEELSDTNEPSSSLVDIESVEEIAHDC